MREINESDNRYWEREPDEKDWLDSPYYLKSVERSSVLERRGIEFEVKVGLELMRVKNILKHGAFLSYEWRVGYGNSETPRRRIERARQYMTYLGIINSPKNINPEKDKIFAALELAYSENPQFVDFDKYQKKQRTPDEFTKELWPDERLEAGLKVTSKDEMFGFSPIHFTKLFAKNWKRWNVKERGDAVMFLVNSHLMLQSLFNQFALEATLKLHDRSNELKAETDKIEQLFHLLIVSKSEDWDFGPKKTRADFEADNTSDTEDSDTIKTCNVKVLDCGNIKQLKGVKL